MIVIASDKFKGTLSSISAGNAIRQGITDLCGGNIRVVAMADGGEGTAEALGAKKTRDGFYEYRTPDGSIHAYVPSCGEGLPWESKIASKDTSLHCRTSHELGMAICRAAECGLYKHIDIGIGGTQTADGGLGMLEAMGYDIEHDSDGMPIAIKAPHNRHDYYAKTLRGLADVSAPLYSDSGLSAMSFLAQKGGTIEDSAWCRTLFTRLQQLFPGNDLYGGAGGGIGFALESIVGCEVTFGAPVILAKALTGLKPAIIITGEGRVDAQTLGGKAVSAVYAYAERHGIPAVTFCGSVASGLAIDNVYPCITDGSPLPSDPYESLLKTAEAARPYIDKLI